MVLATEIRNNLRDILTGNTMFGCFTPLSSRAEVMYALQARKRLSLPPDVIVPQDVFGSP